MRVTGTDETSGTPLLGRGRTAPRVIALLTTTPGQELHTREVIRRLGLSERPVHEALVKLERQNVIQSRRVGNLRLWRMDPGHPLFALLRELTTKTVGVVAHLRTIIGDRPGVDCAFVFGSYAANQDDATSDIDVFVLGSPDWGAIDKEIARLSGELGREINIVGWAYTDLARAAAHRSTFLDTLRHTTKIWILGDQDGFERRIRRVGPAESPGRPADTRQPRRSAGQGRPRPEERRPRKKAARGR